MTAFEEHMCSHESGAQTFFLAAGPEDGPLVVLCHGWPAIAQTWVSQMEALAAVGYRVIAPDMPGYGKSTVSQNPSDYSLQVINRLMAELLSHCGRNKAIWAGHDWGAVAVWSFAAHYPRNTVAVVGIARPYRTLELGLEGVTDTINRDVYPVEKYPYGQYDYQMYFVEAFEKATAWFEEDTSGVLKAIYRKGSPEEVGKPAATATVRQDGGWFGGSPHPPPELQSIPLESICIDKAMFDLVVTSMSRTGFHGANSWYSNHSANRAYALEQSHNGGVLHMPVLFIGANWDPISDVAVSSIAAEQKKFCADLTEVYLDAGHWVALEKPHEVNASILAWLMEHVPNTWPCAGERVASA